MGGFPNQLDFDSPQRTGGSPCRQRLVFGEIMSQGRCGRRRRERRMVRKRDDCWALRRFTTARAAPKRRRLAASDCSRRNWVVRFNAHGREGLIDRKAPGQPPRLNDEHRAALAAVLEIGPIPAVHGIVRRRIVDLCQWIFEEFRVVVSQQTLSRVLRKMGYRKLSARPRRYAQAEGAIEDFKKPVDGLGPPVAVETGLLS